MSETQMVIQDSGNGNRLGGAAFALASGIWFLSKMPLEGWLFLAVGLGLFIFATDLTVTADRTTRILTMKYHSWFLLNHIRKIPFDEISTIRFDRQSGSSTTSSGYRIEVVLHDGKHIPFRIFHISRAFELKPQAKQLAAFIKGRHETSPKPAEGEDAYVFDSSRDYPADGQVEGSASQKK